MATDLRAQLQAALGAAYTVERELGGGGMSRVFVAIETTLNRRVVVKVLPPELAAEVSVERFRREIQVAAQLQNPHIVPLLAAGEAGGLLYYTMPYVEGESLRAQLVRDGELPVPTAVQVVRDVAKALAYAHRHGVVHRDIKPENILQSEGDALVADFGVAKALSASTTSGAAGLTSVGMALGTPAYMSPEQAAGESSVDHRADLYALGAVAYEMLTGQGMFPGRSPQALLAAHTTETPESIERRRPNIPPPLAALVMRLLAKRPADRPQSADEVLREMEGYAATIGTTFTPAAAVRPRAQSRWLVAAALGFVGIGAAVAVARARRAPHAAAGAAAQASIAVLPFVNMSDDKKNEYFSDGMTEELIDRLAKVRALRVAARTSSFAFKGKDVDVREIGRQLGVHNLVEGSVRRDGSHVRITAQLIDADSGYHRWSNSYDGDAKDVFAVQQQIGSAIAAELNLALVGRDSAVLARAPTKDLAAHSLYLEGLYFWNRRTAAALEQAIRLFSAAIARDSTYADAYAGLALTYAVLPYYVNLPSDSIVGKSLAAANAALALDSTLSAPHAALGSIRTFQLEWSVAAAEYERAIALSSNDANAHHWYGFLLGLNLGRLDDAEREFKRSIELDPLALVTRTDYAAVLLAAHREADAEREVRLAIELDPANPGGWTTLGMVFAVRGMPDSAIAMLQRGVAMERPEPFAGDLGMLGEFLAAAGRRDSALAVKRQLEARGRRGYVSPAAIALIDLGFGHLDSAVAGLARAIDTRDPWVANIFPMDRTLDKLRSDPRFGDLKRRMKLPP